MFNFWTFLILVSFAQVCETISGQEASEHKGAFPSQALPQPCQMCPYSAYQFPAEFLIRLRVCVFSFKAFPCLKQRSLGVKTISIFLHLLHKERGKGLPGHLRGSSDSWGPLYTFHLWNSLWFHEALFWPCVFCCKHIATCMLNKQTNENHFANTRPSPPSSPREREENK